MKKQFTITLYLDTRRQLKSGKYPLRLRVYHLEDQKTRFYSTPFAFDEEEYKDITTGQKLKQDQKTIRANVIALEKRAEDVASSLDLFDFDTFERVLYQKPGAGSLISTHYEEAIKDYHRRGQVGTASSYDLSAKVLKRFFEEERGILWEKLKFKDITPTALKDFEHWFCEIEGRTRTSAGIYLRATRALFNRAIELGDIPGSVYPFGRKRYQIPASAGRKMALSKAQLKTLFESVPESKEQQRAKDFWFLSYLLNGANFKDILMLKWKDIDTEAGTVSFIREKTKHTAKNQKVITAFLSDFVLQVIGRYGSDEKSPDSYVFRVLSKGMTPQEQKAKINNFISTTNQGIKKVATASGLPDKISTYTARHTFATIGIQEGASLEFMQQMLGHDNLQTTQAYFAGFDSETRKEFSKKLLNFD